MFKTILHFIALLQRGTFLQLHQFCQECTFYLVTIENVDSPSTCTQIHRFMKGIFHLRPPQPRYTTTWDVNIVLSFLKLRVPQSKIILKELTLKPVTPIGLISGLRTQSIHDMDTLLVQRSEDCITFTFKPPSKQAKYKLHQSKLNF